MPLPLLSVAAAEGRAGASVGSPISTAIYVRQEVGSRDGARTYQGPEGRQPPGSIARRCCRLWSLRKGCRASTASSRRPKQIGQRPPQKEKMSSSASKMAKWLTSSTLSASILPFCEATRELKAPSAGANRCCRRSEALCAAGRGSSWKWRPTPDLGTRATSS